MPYIQNTLKLNERAFDKLKHRLWCFSASIRQPRKDDGTCNKTPFFHRWDTNLITSHLTLDDPRYAAKPECQRTFATLLALTLEADGIAELPPNITEIVKGILGRPLQPKNLTCIDTGVSISSEDIQRSLNYSSTGLGGYEIPVSYKQKLNTGGRHEPTNVGWMKPLHINYELRKSLRQNLQSAGVSSTAIKNVLD